MFLSNIGFALSCTLASHHFHVCTVVSWCTGSWLLYQCRNVFCAAIDSISALLQRVASFHGIPSIFVHPPHGKEHFSKVLKIESENGQRSKYKMHYVFCLVLLPFIFHEIWLDLHSPLLFVVRHLIYSSGHVTFHCPFYGGSLRPLEERSLHASSSFFVSAFCEEFPLFFILPVVLPLVLHLMVFWSPLGSTFWIIPFWISSRFGQSV